MRRRESVEGVVSFGRLVVFWEEEGGCYSEEGRGG